jgi:hypothetical protein
VGRQGLGSNVTAFLNDIEEFMTTETVLVPDINQILACDTVEALKALLIPILEVEENVTYFTFAKNALPGPLC